MQQAHEVVARALHRVDPVIAQRHGPPRPALADVLAVEHHPQREDVDVDGEITVVERLRVLDAALVAGELEPRELLVGELEQRAEAKQPPGEVPREVAGLVADAMVDGRPGVLHDRADLDLGAQPAEPLPLLGRGQADDVVIGAIAEAIRRIVLALAVGVLPVDLELAVDQRPDRAHVARVVHDHPQPGEIGDLLQRVGVLALGRDLLAEALDRLRPRLDLRELDRLARDARVQLIAQHHPQRVERLLPTLVLNTPIAFDHTK